MQALSMFLRLFGYNSFWGLKLGLILGLFYYLIVFVFNISIYIFYWTLLGGALGTLLGGINGILFFFTSYGLYKRLNFNFYKIIMLCVAVITSIILCFNCFAFIASAYSPFPDRPVDFFNIPFFVALLFAIILGGILSQRTVNFYARIEAQIKPNG